MKHLILLFCSFLLPAFAHAQLVRPVQEDSVRMVVIETVDGNEFFGKVLEDTPDAILLETTTLGQVRIPKVSISVLKEGTKGRVVDGEYWHESPHATRYFFAPTGYGLRKGEGYYNNSMVFLNQVSYGVSDNFSIGLSAIPFVVTNALWITPKVSIPLKKDYLNAGVGVLAGGIFTTFDENFFLGLPYANLTLGSRNQNFTVGLGYGYGNGQWAQAPTLMIGSTARTGKKFAIVTENYFLGNTLDGPSTILSLGGRFLGKRVALDAAITGFLGSGSDFFFFAWPWVSVTVPFRSSPDK
jgi:hypothetical protein